MKLSIRDRQIAFFITFFFAFTNLIPPTFSSAFFDNIPVPFFELNLPTALGKIEELYLPHSSVSTPFVFHIKTAHGDVGIQKKVKEILCFLHKSQGISLIFAEGASEKLNPELLVFFNDPTLNQKMTDRLVEKGFYTGVDLFLLEANDRVEVLGIEKVNFYRAAYKAFRKVLRNSKTVQRTLDLLESKLDREASKILSKEEFFLLKSWQKFQKRETDFLAYLNFIQKVAARHLDLDFRNPFLQLEWPQLVRIARLQEFQKNLDEEKLEEEKKKIGPLLTRNDNLLLENPRRYFEEFLGRALSQGFRFENYPHLTRWMGVQILGHELDGRMLLLELEKLWGRITGHIKDEESRQIISRYEELMILRKLLSLELTRREWEKVKSTNHVWQVAHRKESSFRSPHTPYAVSHALSSAYRFYHLAERREAFFFEKMVEQMESRKASKVIFVTGGFHTPALTQFFKEKGLGYAVISPRVEGEVSHALYRETMLKGSHLEITEFPQLPQTKISQKGRRMFQVEAQTVKEVFRELEPAGDWDATAYAQSLSRTGSTSPGTWQKNLTYRRTFAKPERKNRAEVRALNRRDLFLPKNLVGVQGLKEADRFLKEKSLVGIVIGSTARDLWSKSTRETQLDRHTDVDIVILNDTFPPKEDFPRGIDWWFPVRRKIQERDLRLYVNRNHILLRGGIKVDHEKLKQLAPGLYLPNREFLVNLSVHVALASIPSTLIDQVLQDRLHAYVNRWITTTVSGVWQKHFGKMKQVIEETGLLEVEPFDYETVRMISRHTVYVGRPAGYYETLLGKALRSIGRNQSSRAEVRAAYPPSKEGPFQLYDEVSFLFQKAGVDREKAEMKHTAKGIHLATGSSIVYEISKELSRGRPLIGIDAGGGQGEFAIQMARLNSDLTMIAIEEDQELFEDSQKLLQAALDLGLIRQGQVELYHGDFNDPKFQFHFQKADFVYYYSYGTENISAFAETLQRNLTKEGAQIIEFGTKGKSHLASHLKKVGLAYDFRVLKSVPGVKIFTRRAEVRSGTPENEYYVLYKPKGLLSEKDEQGRGGRTIYDLFRERTGKDPSDFHAMGRLDRDVDGLMILTNDGSLVSIIMPPAHVEKKYLVTVAGEVTEEEAQRLREGVDIQTRDSFHREITYRTKPARVEIVSSGPSQSILHLYIIEGKYHQVKRMMEVIGHRVINLTRVGIADIELNRDIFLRPGHVEKLTGASLAKLLDAKVTALNKLAELEQREPALALHHYINFLGFDFPAAQIFAREKILRMAASPTTRENVIKELIHDYRLPADSRVASVTDLLVQLAKDYPNSAFHLVHLLAASLANLDEAFIGKVRGAIHRLMENIPGARQEFKRLRDQWRGSKERETARERLRQILLEPEGGAQSRAELRTTSDQYVYLHQDYPEPFPIVLEKVLKLTDRKKSDIVSIHSNLLKLPLLINSPDTNFYFVKKGEMLTFQFRPSSRAEVRGKEWKEPRKSNPIEPPRGQPSPFLVDPSSPKQIGKTKMINTSIFSEEARKIFLSQRILGDMKVEAEVRRLLGESIRAETAFELGRAIGVFHPKFSREVLIVMFQALRISYLQLQQELIPAYIKEIIESFQANGISFERHKKGIGAEILLYDHVPTESEMAALIFSLAMNLADSVPAEVVIYSKEALSTEELEKLEGYEARLKEIRDIRGKPLEVRFFQNSDSRIIGKHIQKVSSELVAKLTPQIAAKYSKSVTESHRFVRSHIVVTLNQDLANRLEREDPLIVYLLYGMKQVRYETPALPSYYSAVQSAAVALSQKDYEAMGELDRLVLERRAPLLFVSRYDRIPENWHTAWILAEARISEMFRQAA